MTIETGTIYTVATIAEHTGLSASYLRNSNSSLRKFIAGFPQLSPDGKGLNDEGLILYDEYLRFCSSLDSKGNRRQPEMTFEQFKEYAMDEYGIGDANYNDDEMTGDLTLTEPTNLTEVEVMPVQSMGSVLDGIDEKFEQMGTVLAAKIRNSMRENVINKVANELNLSAAELQQLLNQISQ